MDVEDAYRLALGWHWIFDGTGIPNDRLSSRELIADALRTLPLRLGLTIISTPQIFVHEAAVPSIGGVILLAESHFSLHSFPGRGILHGDLFSCREISVVDARNYIQQAFGMAELHERLLVRGPLENKGNHQ